MLRLKGKESKNMFSQSGFYNNIKAKIRERDMEGDRATMIITKSYGTRHKQS